MKLDAVLKHTESRQKRRDVTETVKDKGGVVCVWDGVNIGQKGSRHALCNL